jgi:hypothetical protein
VCLKLWPVPVHSGTIAVPEAAAARAVAYRPLAVLETEAGARVFVAGTAEEVEGQAADLGGVVRPGLDWPEPPATPWVLSLRVPAARTVAAVDEVRRLGDGVRYQAAHGVGDVTIGMDELDVASCSDLRRWAEDQEGAVVVVRRPRDDETGFDPWGTPPATIDLQRRVKAAFDPAGIVNPGRLPGRI